MPVYTFTCTDGTECGGEGTFNGSVPWFGLTNEQLDTIANNGFVELTPDQVQQNKIELDDNDKEALKAFKVLHIEHKLGVTSCDDCGANA
ncbi:hypothetical protein [Noviherbaspirillum aridicola]|uniref:Uncharacterized protein n=1 Tax=Noviherbaspirillum aridicola TaxID=2849687 RepID=A0ABQ4QAH8_9BURK|nr:hypothetical protein [Noviherbaspirillum aridicola]GIZ54069.1 hypothetical protein NCCP691_40830 [Noviherbaspirillum aridicola]